MTTKNNGTVLKIVVGSLISAVMLLAGLGYNSISARLDKIEAKMDRVVSLDTEVDNLKARSIENRTLILEHIAATAVPPVARP